MGKEVEIIRTVKIPEIDQKTVDNDVEENTLTGNGGRKIEEGTEREDYYRLERPHEHVSHSFALPHTMDQERVGATPKDAVLRVVLPKKEEARLRLINVKVG